MPRRRMDFPLIVARDASGITGFGTFGEFRAWPCYRHSVEHSVHVRADRRGQGIGRALVVELLARAAAMLQARHDCRHRRRQCRVDRPASQPWIHQLSAIFTRWDSSSGAGSTWCSCNVSFRRQLTPAVEVTSRDWCTQRRQKRHCGTDRPPGSVSELCWYRSLDIMRPW